MQSETVDFRTVILAAIRQRNAREGFSYESLIRCNNRLFDSNEQLKKENLRLVVENERIRQNGPTAADGAVDIARLQQLEKKLMAQQEELTELHKRKGENAQQLMELNASLRSAERTLGERDSTIRVHVETIASLRAEIAMLNSSLSELKSLNSVLRDEHTALQLAFASLEAKLRQAQDENRQMVERLMKYKAKDAEKMNEENESFLKKVKEKMQRELEDAARDGRRPESPFGKEVTDQVLRGLASLPFLFESPNGVLCKWDSHDGEVNAVRWSPCERILATGGADRKVKLWDLTKGQRELLGTLVGNNAGVNSVEFDINGSMVIATSNDFASRVWTVADQRLRHTLTGHSGKVMAAKFLAEPSKVVTGSHDRTLKIWDLRSRACVETKFAGSSCNDLVTTDGSGSTIISGHFDKKIRFWDTRTDCTANDIDLQGKITSLDLSKDGKYLLCCCRDDTIKLLDLRQNSIVRTFSHDNFKVGCDWARVSFSPDGAKVAAGGADGVIYIWNVTGQLETTLKDHNASVTAVSWHPLSSVLASVDRAKKCVVWTSSAGI